MEIVISVRQAREDDVDGILRCLAEAFEPYRDEYTAGAFADTIVGRENIERRMKEMTVFVASVNDYVVGTIGCEAVQPKLAHGENFPIDLSHMPSREGHIRGMAVLAKHQGAGIANMLLIAAEQSLKSLGCARVTLDTTEPLKRAQRFYERHGYKPTGKVTDFHGMKLIELAKDI